MYLYNNGPKIYYFVYAKYFFFNFDGLVIILTIH